MGLRGFGVEPSTGISGSVPRGYKAGEGYISQRKTNNYSTAHDDWDMVAQENIMYSTNGGSIFAYDISDLPSITEIASVGPAELVDARTISVAGDILVAQDIDDYKLVFFDITSTGSMSVLGTFSMNEFAFGGSTSPSFARDHVYKYDSDALTMRVIDISDPTAPTEVATFDPQTGDRPDTGVALDTPYGDRMYAIGDSNVSIIDIDDPTSPTVVSSVGGPMDSIAGLALDTTRELIYTSTWSWTKVSVIDFSGDSLTVRGSTSNSIDGMRAIRSSGHYVYVAREKSLANNKAACIDVRDPDNPTKVYEIVDSSGNGTGAVEVSDGFLMFSNKVNDINVHG